MQRRFLLVAALTPAYAHHGWSGFNQDRPLYLKGTARKVAWRNPHVEFDLELPADLALPPDLPRRSVPAQSAGVDSAWLLANARLPTRKDRGWHIELAPLTRMEQWKLSEIRNGELIEVLGYTTTGEKGDPVLRAEYLFVGDHA